MWKMLRHGWKNLDRGRVGGHYGDGSGNQLISRSHQWKTHTVPHLTAWMSCSHFHLTLRNDGRILQLPPARWYHTFLQYQEGLALSRSAMFHWKAWLSGSLWVRVEAICSSKCPSEDFSLGWSSSPGQHFQHRTPDLHSAPCIQLPCANPVLSFLQLFSSN